MRKIMKIFLALLLTFSTTIFSEGPKEPKLIPDGHYFSGEPRTVGMFRILGMRIGTLNRNICTVHNLDTITLTYQINVGLDKLGREITLVGDIFKDDTLNCLIKMDNENDLRIIGVFAKKEDLSRYETKANILRARKYLNNKNKLEDSLITRFSFTSNEYYETGRH
jgi:hypothetical protein